MNEVNALPDILGAWRYELLITPPNNSGAIRPLCIRCQTVMFPGSGVDVMQIYLNGFLVHYRGRKIFSNQFQATFVEGADALTWLTLKAWQETVVQTWTGNGEYKAGYISQSAVLNVYDAVGASPAQVATIYNLWPSEVPDVQLEGTTSQPFLVSCAFTFDVVEYAGINYTDGPANNPLTPPSSPLAA